VRIIPAIGLVSGLGLATSAFAADLPSRAAPPIFVQPDGYDVTIGAGPNVLNRFPGASQVTVLPSIHIGYRKAGEPDPFYTPDDAFDVAVYENPYFRVGPAANYIENRGLSGGFNGLHTIGGTLELGGFVEVYPIPQHLRIRGEILQGVTGSKGLVGNLGADGIQRMGPFEFSLGPRIGFGNDRYATQYFSVTPAEAAANGIVTPYNARGGLTSVGGLGTIRYDINRQYSVLGFGGYSRLVDSVGNSPIPVRLGSRNQFTAGATLNYTFGFKGFGILGY
jgi:MipA family protein